MDQACRLTWLTRAEEESSFLSQLVPSVREPFPASAASVMFFSC